MDAGLRPLGLSTPQYTVMANLREHPGASGASLARDSFVSPQTMNDLLVGLENDRLIRRVPSQEHGRVIATHLTSLGRRKLESADAIVMTAERRLVASLGADDRENLFQLLKRCADELQRRPRLKRERVRG